MISSLKNFEIIEALKYKINYDNNHNNLLKVLFSDFPKLKKITFSKTNEYNDNDYSDYFNIVSINDVLIDGDQYNDFDDDDDVDKKDLFDDIELEHICSVVSSISDTFENNIDGDTQDINRIDFDFTNECAVKKTEKTDAFEEYYFASKNNKKINDLSVFKDSPNWALYYCMDLGHKLEEKEVESIFCKKNNCVRYAYYYAFYVLKDRLPKKVENIFKEIEKKYHLKSFENTSYTYKELKDIYYMKKYNEFKESLCTTN